MPNWCRSSPLLGASTVLLSGGGDASTATRTDVQAGRRGSARGEQEQAGDYWDGGVIPRLDWGGRREAAGGKRTAAGSRGQRALYSRQAGHDGGLNSLAASRVDAGGKPANSAKTSAEAIAR